jgi:hypothetical protein
MNRVFNTLIALVLVVGFGLVTPTPVAASTIRVPDDHATIQAAVDVAQPGDIIMVAAGTYGAFSVIGRNDISIVGAAGATVMAANLVSIDRGPIGTALSMAAIKDSQNINIQGIDFDGGGLGKEEVVVGIAYVDSTGRIANLTVENTIGTELGAGVAIIGHAGTSVVNLLDVTVRNSMAGVIIWDAEANLDGCSITGMRPAGGFGIMESGVGIVIGIPGAAWQGQSTVKVKGSTISENNDVGIYVCDGSVVEARFNMIYGNAALGVLNDGGQTVDALYNWWGSPAGPLHTSNVVGFGNNAVSDNVDFKPWAKARAVTQTLTDSGVVNAKEEAATEVWVRMRDTGTLVTNPSGAAATDNVLVVVQGSTDNPGGMPPAGITALGRYVDVSVTGSGAEEIEIRLYYTAKDVRNRSKEEQQELLQLRWWDEAVSEWKQYSVSGVNTTDTADGYSGYMWARVTAHTTPSLDQLTGTWNGDFWEGPTDPPGGCFIATAAYGTDAAVEIDVLREFRDTVLVSNSLGAGLVAVYYRTSPPVADLISRHDILRATVRVAVVDPLVAVLNWSQDWW